MLVLVDVSLFWFLLSVDVALYQRWAGFVKCLCQISLLLILHTKGKYACDRVSAKTSCLIVVVKTSWLVSDIEEIFVCGHYHVLKL